MLSQEKMKELIESAKYPNRPGTAAVWSKKTLQQRINNPCGTAKDTARYLDMLNNPDNYGIILKD